MKKDGLKIVSRQPKSICTNKDSEYIVVDDICERIGKSTKLVEEGGLVKVTSTDTDTVRGITESGDRVTMHRDQLKLSTKEFVSPVEEEVLKSATNDDVWLCMAYVQKSKYAKEKGLDFELSFSRYKYLKNLKKCQYTGVRFNANKSSKDAMTLERIDNSIGYTDKNTIAVTYNINQFKAMVENPCTESSSTYKEIYSMCKKLDRLGLI